MSDYSAKYEKQFAQNLCRYASLRQRIKHSVKRVLSAPYNSEFLGDISGKLNLRLWVAEAERRLKELREGTVEEIPVEEVFRRAGAAIS